MGKGRGGGGAETRRGQVMQAASPGGERAGLAATARRVYAQGGAAAFFRGNGARHTELPY